jgi:hypothetical protein
MSQSPTVPLPLGRTMCAINSSFSNSALADIISANVLSILLVRLHMNGSYKKIIGDSGLVLMGLLLLSDGICPALSDADDEKTKFVWIVEQ